jgi:hypothetical protein
MYTIRTGSSLREIIGSVSGKMTRLDREPVMPFSLAIGVAVVLITSLAGCQQFDAKMSIAAALQPVAVVNATADVHDNRWISQAHTLAQKSGADGAVSDLSY